MKKKFIIGFLFLIIVSGLFVLPLMAANQTDTPNINKTGGISIENPLKGQGNDTLMGFLRSVINNIVIPLGGILIALAIIYTGFKFVTAQGNTAKLDEAKTMFFYVVIGAAILLGAWAISQAICGTIDQIGGGGLCG